MSNSETQDEKLAGCNIHVDMDVSESMPMMQA